jgi:hypothetical protein
LGLRLLPIECRRNLFIRKNLPNIASVYLRIIADSPISGRLVPIGKLGFFLRAATITTVDGDAPVPKRLV